MWRFSLLFCAAVAFATFRAATGFGWGDEAHRIIARSASLALPPEIRPFFATCREFLAKHSIDPDMWKTDPEERYRHFLDIDQYGAPPFAKLPRNFNEAVKKFGRETVIKNGTLPWRIEEYVERLTEAMRNRDWLRTRLDAAHLSHYVADMYMPFHATVNYDGQLTGNLGIHGRLEIELVERYLNSSYLPVASARFVENVNEFAFLEIIKSLQLTHPILRADTTIRQKVPLDSDEYYALLFREVGELTRERMTAAATSVGSLWYTAWIRAEKPPIPPYRAVVILIDAMYDPATSPSAAEELLPRAAASLQPHDALAVRVANAPKSRWQRQISFRHAIDCCAPEDGASVSPSYTPEEITGLEEAIAALSTFPNSARLIVFVSDGLSDQAKMPMLVDKLRAAKIRLCSVSISPAGDEQLKSFSDQTKGRFDKVKNLAQALATIPKQLPGLLD